MPNEQCPLRNFPCASKMLLVRSVNVMGILFWISSDAFSGSLSDPLYRSWKRIAIEVSVGGGHSLTDEIFHPWRWICATKTIMEFVVCYCIDFLVDAAQISPNRPFR